MLPEVTQSMFFWDLACQDLSRCSSCDCSDVVVVVVGGGGSGGAVAVAVAVVMSHSYRCLQKQLSCFVSHCQ